MDDARKEGGSTDVTAVPRSSDCFRTSGRFLPTRQPEIFKRRHTDMYDRVSGRSTCNVHMDMNYLPYSACTYQYHAFSRVQTTESPFRSEKPS